MAWSQTGALLAAATAKGNLQLFATRERRNTPIVGKHCKRVVCGVWGAGNRLALAGLDGVVSLSPSPTHSCKLRVARRFWRYRGHAYMLAVTARHTLLC